VQFEEACAALAICSAVVVLYCRAGEPWAPDGALVLSQNDNDDDLRALDP